MATNIDTGLGSGLDVDGHHTKLPRFPRGAFLLGHGRVWPIPWGGLVHQFLVQEERAALQSSSVFQRGQLGRW